MIPFFITSFNTISLEKNILIWKKIKIVNKDICRKNRGYTMEETPADEKRCPICNSKLLIHSESHYRRTVYCSNPRCSYKGEL
jgi:hypothetical protein